MCLFNPRHFNLSSEIRCFFFMYFQNSPVVEQSSFRRLVPENNAETVGIWGPLGVVDRSLLAQLHHGCPVVRGQVVEGLVAVVRCSCEEMVLVRITPCKKLC